MFTPYMFLQRKDTGGGKRYQEPFPYLEPSVGKRGYQREQKKTRPGLLFSLGVESLVD